MSSEPRTTTFNRFNSRSYNAEIAQLQSALDDGYTDNNFSGYIKPVPHFKAVIGRLFLKIILTFTSEHFFYPCSFAKKRCNTSQGFGAFFFQSCDHCSFFNSFLVCFSLALSWFYGSPVLAPLSVTQRSALAERGSRDNSLRLLVILASFLANRYCACTTR